MITDQNDVFGNIEKEFPEYEFRCKNMLLIIPQSCEFPKNPTREEHGIKAIDNLPEVCYFQNSIYSYILFQLRI